MRIYTAELTVYDEAILATRQLAFSTSAFVSKPTDTPSNTEFLPRIKQPAFLRMDAFSPGTTGGAASFGIGDLVLNNADGALDGMLDYGVDGRDITLRVGDTAAVFPAGFSVVLQGAMQFLEADGDTMKVRIRPRDLMTEIEFQANRFTGSNVLPDGLEGLPDDLKGAVKPRCYGRVFNVKPPLVNSARLIYQVNDGNIETLPQVYDRGVPLTAGADYTSQVDMETNAPAPGEYRPWIAGGYFRLGALPAGVVTADVVCGMPILEVGQSADADRTVGQLFKQILLGPGKITAGIDEASVTALDAANSAVAGIFVDAERTVSEVLDFVCQSVGAYWGVTPTGSFFVRRWEAPSGTPVLDLTQHDVIEPFERRASNDQTRGTPPHTVLVYYGRNYTVQDTDLSGSVPADRRAYLAADFRVAAATNQAIKTKHHLSGVFEVNTALAFEADAVAEATRLLALHGQRRDIVSFVIALTPAVAAVLDLGIVVRLTHPRFGCQNGKLFRLLGYELDSARNRAALMLWG